MNDTDHKTENTSSGHTSGPWHYQPSTYTIRDKRNVWIATMDSWDGLVKPHNEANARLIAAAPELLASLQEVIRICEAMRYTAGLGRNQLERIERAKALIAGQKERAA